MIADADVDADASCPGASSLPPGSSLLARLVTTYLLGSHRVKLYFRYWPVVYLDPVNSDTSTRKLKKKRDELVPVQQEPRTKDYWPRAKVGVAM